MDNSVTMDIKHEESWSASLIVNAPKTLIQAYS